MRELLAGYSRPTQEQFQQMWQECTFVFDANVLLNIYRYTTETRSELFDILESLKGRTWVPHQVMLEYLENREGVIAQQYSLIADIEKALEEVSRAIEEKYKRGHLFADTKLITRQIRGAMENIKAFIVRAQSQYPDLLENDVFLDRLIRIFDGRVGNEYPLKKLEEIYKELEQRFRLQVPPGYRDKNAKQEGFKKYGDGVVWFQIIDYAKSQKKPVIFITDDRKDDWWRKEKGETLGPRPELIIEIRSKAKINFYSYNADQFLKYAKEFLGVEVEQRTIDEVRDVSQRIMGSYKLTTTIRHGYQALDTVQSWLKTAYSEYEILEEYEVWEEFDSTDVDLLLIGQDGTRIGVVVKYSETFLYLDEFEKLLKLARDPKIGQALSQFLMVLACKDEFVVNLVRTHIPSMLSIPINSRFIIGYINAEGQFSLVSNIP